MFQKRLFTIATAAVLLIVIGFTIQGVVATKSVTGAIAVTGANAEKLRMERVNSAETARLAGLAQDYFMKQAHEAERVLRAREADTARWNAMAADYFAQQNREAERSQRAWAADTARWNGMAKFYAAQKAQLSSSNR